MLATRSNIALIADPEALGYNTECEIIKQLCNGR